MLKLCAKVDTPGLPTPEMGKLKIGSRNIKGAIIKNKPVDAVVHSLLTIGT